MRKFLFSISLLFSFSLLMAQTAIPNGGFETWDNPTGANAEPTNWNSNKTGGGLASSGPQTCFRQATNPHGGLYAVRVRTGSIFGTVVNGSCSTGKIEAPSSNKAEGYIRTIAGDPNFSSAFTGRPDSLVFWLKYSPASGAEQCRVQAILHVGNCYTPEAPFNNNHPDSTVNIIARATYQAAASYANWARISVPFIYVDNRTPQYILISMTSSADQLNGVANSEMTVDDMEAIYNPKITLGTVATGPFYVSATQSTPVSVPYTLLGTYNAGNTLTAELSNSSGSFTSPVSIGTLNSQSNGTISASIPAGTVSGSGYRIRVRSSNPQVTSADNGNNIQVILVSNSIAPATAQNLITNVPGSTLNVTETAGLISRNWLFSTTSGGPYTSFTPAVTGTSWSPVFSSPGSYFVVCQTTYPGGLTVQSNEVQFTVSGNSISPSGAQSILAGVNGATLSVTETPAGTSREWKFATTSGGPYSSFSPVQTGLTYTPNFASNGSYYVVCQSVIGGNTATSNEVLITVSTVSLTTGAISGSPFFLSPSAPAAAVSVPFTTSGTFNAGNVFTAQLSDAQGSFATPLSIGTLNGTSSGIIAASIPSGTAEGSLYRIRVVSSSPNITGSDNGSDLIIDQYSNSVSPGTPQTVGMNISGTALTVTESQPTTTREWRWSATSGSGYQSFSPAQTNATYTPLFQLPGTYYIVCASKNTFNDEVISNEVIVTVENGNTITTGTVIGSPFRISPNAQVQSNISFTSTAVFSPSNVFEAQISDFTGSFANPLTIGTLNGNTVSFIPCTIPNSLPEGNAYRIRVVSTNPAIIGTDNGVNLQVIPFAVDLTPTDTQFLAQGQLGNPITASSSHSASFRWKYTQISGSFYQPVSPANNTSTYSPSFVFTGNYYIVCEGVNTWNDTVLSAEAVVIVRTPTDIKGEKLEAGRMFSTSGGLMVDLSGSPSGPVKLELIDLSGRVVLTQIIQGGTSQLISHSLTAGNYLFRLSVNEQQLQGKINIR